MEVLVWQYIDVPFAEKGRSAEGWDCWGLVYCIYRDRLGITLPAYSEQYENTADRDEIAALVNREKGSWIFVAKDPRPYDVVVLRVAARPMHVALYIGNGKIVHALENEGTVVEPLNSITWRNRIAGYYRHSAAQSV